MGTARWTYNQCVRLVKDKKVEAWDIKQLRSHVIAAHNHVQLKQMSKSSKRTRKKKMQIIKLRKQRQKNGGATAWVVETPMEIRDAAAMDW